MKRTIFLAAFLAIFSANSFAQSPADDYQRTRKSKQPALPSVHTLHLQQQSEKFFLRPFLSVEYSAPTITGGGSNADFKTNIFEKQVKDLENIALGLNVRVHDFLGFNANWAQTELNNTALQGFSLAQKARFNLDHYNLSALVYFPLEKNLFEIFAEAGISDMNSKLRYTTSNGDFTSRKAHETMAFYGGGFQLNPFQNSKNAIRFSCQKYSGKLALLNSHYAVVRVGYLHEF